MDRTVLILGAGFTRAVAGSKPKKKLPPLDRDFFDIASRLSKRKSEKIYHYLDEFVGEYRKNICSSMETAYSYLYLKALDAKKGDEAHKAYILLQELLGEILADNTDPLPVGPASLMYRLFLSELSRVEKSADLSIITFNYDIVIERILAQLSAHNQAEFCFPGCYRLEPLQPSKVVEVTGANNIGPTDLDAEGVAVLKLHGSFNWHSAHTSSEPLPSALTNPKRELFVSNSVKIMPIGTLKRNTRTSYIMPIIVPPVSGKRRIMHKMIPPLWKTAEKILRSANRIVIAGYSCPDFDLEARILLSENLRKNPKKNVYVIDPNPQVASRFADICGVDHITIYNSAKAWLRDAGS